MKLNATCRVLTLLVLVATASLTVISTTAQNTVRPTFVTGDTSQESKTLNTFEVQLTADQDGQKFILVVSNPFAEKLRISISGPEGLGFSDQTKQPYYRKRINLANAQDGQYTVSITGNKRSYTKTIRLNTDFVQTRSINVE